MTKKSKKTEEPANEPVEDVSQTKDSKIPENFNELPYHVKRILNSIENHQMRVKDLVEQLEDRYSLTDVIDEDSKWTWGMHVDLQGEAKLASENGDLLIEFLNRAANKE